MRIRFDEQLELLNRKLIEMGALCEDAISASMHTLKNEADKKSAEKAAALEREIDHKEREIESLCMKLLLQQQPVARDLRTISSALKMISDLERIGDQASDIAGITGYIEDEQLKSGTHIYEMARAASRMVTDSVDSFVRKDLGKARAVQKEDDIVDGLFDTVKNELVGQITEHPDLSGEPRSFDDRKVSRAHRRPCRECGRVGRIFHHRRPCRRVRGTFYDLFAGGRQRHSRACRLHALQHRAGGHGLRCALGVL